MNLFEGEQQVEYVKTVGDNFIGGGALLLVDS